MSSFALLRQLVLLADGAHIGATLACIAVRSLINYFNASFALDNLRNAPCVPVSGLRPLLEYQNKEAVVFVRGTVDVVQTMEEKGWLKSLVDELIKSAVYGGWINCPPPDDLVLNSSSRLQGVLLQKTKVVPFVLKEDGQQTDSDHLVVNMEGSKHPLPLVTVYHKRQSFSSWILLRALCGEEHNIGLLDEEKVLPIGNEITAVGVCRLKGGVPQIKSCDNLPYFLSNMTKDEIILDLSFRMKTLMWSGIVIGSISVCILGYSIARYLKRTWSLQQIAHEEARPHEGSAHEEEGEVRPHERSADDEEGEVPERNQCVVCLSNRRGLVFVPCGHLICCRECGSSVQKKISPKCPVCRQRIRSSVRIYESRGFKLSKHYVGIFERV